jgi:hypothetical protein
LSPSELSGVESSALFGVLSPAADPATTICLFRGIYKDVEGQPFGLFTHLESDSHPVVELELAELTVQRRTH